MAEVGHVINCSTVPFHIRPIASDGVLATAGFLQRIGTSSVKGKPIVSPGKGQDAV